MHCYLQCFEWQQLRGSEYQSNKVDQPIDQELSLRSTLIRKNMGRWPCMFSETLLRAKQMPIYVLYNDAIISC